MKAVVKILILPTILLFGTTTKAKDEVDKKRESKTKLHQCAVYKNNALKAKKLYSENKKQMTRLERQLKHLSKDQSRMPASVPMAKKVVDSRIQKLKVDKKQRLARTLKYLEQHIEFSEAARKTCALNVKRKAPRKNHFRGQDISEFLHLAANSR